MANRIILGQTGQTLRHVPIGVVTNATYTFEDLAYTIDDESSRRIIASGSATVASWSLTSSATAGPTQTNGARISVEATTGASLRAPAVIVAPDGSRELLEIAGLSSGSYIEAASSLAGVYPAGSTIYGVLVSASVPDDFVAGVIAGETAQDRYRRKHPLRITWTYTLDGTVRRVPEIVEWVRHDAADQLVGDAVLRLTKLYPLLRERVPGGGSLDSIVELLAEDVADDLRERSVDPSTFLVGARGRNLLMARVLAHLGEHGWTPASGNPEAWAAAASKRYADKLNSLTIGTPGHNTAETSTSSDSSGGTPSQIHRSIFAKM